MNILRHDPVDFRQLTDFQWQKRLRGAFARAGLADPYFRLHDKRENGRIRIDGRWLNNFSSYDYLGLHGDARVNEAAIAAIRENGTTVSASRLVAGEMPFHRHLEQELASLYGVEDAVTMVSGHATNVTTIGHLLSPKDLLLYDQRAHNSIIVGGQLSHVDRKPFSHNDLDDLERKLRKLRSNYRRCMIAVEGLYSMDGDTIDLRRLVDIKKRHHAWLLVDEAHALGVLGNSGRGSGEMVGLDGAEVDIWMGTLSKSLVSAGGYIAGSRDMVEILRTSAPGFVFSVGLAPSASAAALAALQLMLQQPERVRRVQRQGALFKRLAGHAGLDSGTSLGAGIIPLFAGDTIKALAWSQRLFERGVNVLPIVQPAVPVKNALLRFFVTASHSDEQIEETVELARQSWEEINDLQLNYDRIREQVLRDEV